MRKLLSLFFIFTFYFLNSGYAQYDVSKTIKPGDDFFEYVNESWMKNNTIPADKSRWGAFDELRDNTVNNLNALFASLSSEGNFGQGTPGQKILDFYKLGMDTVTLNNLDMKPLEPYLGKINGIRTKSDLFTVASYFKTIGISTIFSIFADPDPDNSDIMMARLWQSGLSLPNKDYYTKTDARSEKIREAFKTYIQNLFTLSGDSPETALKNAEIVYNMEMQISGFSKNAVENDDPKIINNRITLQALESDAPSFEFKSMLADIGYPSIKEFNVGQPDFFKNLSKMIDGTSVDNWKVFLKYKLLNGTGNFLSSRFESAMFDFYNKQLMGQQKMEPRFKRVVETLNGRIGELIGQAYVAKYFSAEAKQRMLELVSNLRKSFRNIITNLDWMSEETKLKALEKLDAIDVKIGYPGKWKDYSGLEIKNDSYLDNVIRANNFLFKSGSGGMNIVGKPTDKSVWMMPPQTVNAYYEPSRNEIVFPAGILQTPFFDMNADDATNYGAIGMVIGHEITHGFDNNGRLYDKVGNLKDWWTEKDDKEFKARSKMLVDQYNKYEALPEVFVKGDLTLGENIADLGGINMSFGAYKIARESKGKEGIINGFTPEQRFFMSLANIWKQNTRDEALRVQVQTDSHSPARYRVNGVVFNVNEFYAAFPEVKEGDKLFRSVDSRPVIWSIRPLN